MAEQTQAPTTSPRRVGLAEPDARTDHLLDDGEHDRFTHYVSKVELARARRKGTPVTALCGKRWVPDGDPSRYPMCPTCAELAADRIARRLGS